MNSDMLRYADNKYVTEVLCPSHQDGEMNNNV